MLINKGVNNMKKLFILFSIIFLGGCMTLRTYTIEKPRTDLDVLGNQGYLTGSSKGTSKKNKFGDTRKISVIEFELKSKEDIGYQKKEKKRYIKEDIIKQDIIKQELFLDEEALNVGKDEYTISQDTDYDSIEEVGRGVTEKEKEYKYYTIQKNDTLQKVSQKFYDTTKKWKLIFDYNKKVIKKSNNIYPGMRIKIPKLN